MPRTLHLAEFRLILLVACAFGANSMIMAAQKEKGTEDELKGTWVVVAVYDADGKRLALEKH
jgi:hypothetical protein